MSFPSIIKYFRECYFHDNRSVSVSNIFSKDVENLQLIEGEEQIINSYLPYYPVSEQFVESTESILRVYEKEKELCYFSFLLCGIEYVNGRKRKVVAPLYLFPAEIKEEEDLAYLEIDKNNQRFNTEILRPFFSQEKTTEDFNEVASSKLLTMENYDSLGFVVDKYFDRIETTALLDFPHVFNEKKIKRLTTPSQLAKKESFFLIPASGYGIISKKGETLGILNELEAIGDSNSFSPSLRALFTEAPTSSASPIIGKVPGILSKAQQRAMQAASKYPLSLIIGPPGTGKSYTLASLAIDFFSKGKSVLIVSRTDKAVDVVANKIEKELSLANVIVRAGRKQYHKELKTRLEDLLHGADLLDHNNKRRLNFLNREIKTQEKTLANLESEFLKNAHFDRKWGRFLSDTGTNTKLFLKLKKAYIKWRSMRARPSWEIINAIDKAQDLLTHRIEQYLKEVFQLQTSKALNLRRSQVKLMLQAFRARTGARKEALFNKINYDTMLSTFPIWLVNMKDLHKALPLTEGLFDLAIIDEATQCDIASSLPVFQRAKHVAVTGDPRQLRHLSFLAGSTQRQLQDKYALNKLDVNPEYFNYRKASILDLVSQHISAQEQVSFLNEHYRSTPAIIRFSNQHIYKGAIQVMTKKPDIPVNQGIELIDCKGKRDNQGVNEAEAIAIVEEVKSIYKAEVDFAHENCQSVGILSPFRNQVEHIKLLCARELGTNVIEKHDLLIGTAYEFQGEERDVMLLSFCVDDDSHSMAYYHMNKPDVFNVSITRARSLQVVYYSFTPSQLPLDNLARKYIEDIRQELSINPPPEIRKDDFLREVEKELTDMSIKAWPGYQIAGLKVDIVVKHNEQCYGIDLIGFPGEFEDAFTLERYRILRRAKLPVMPLPYSAWIFQKEECIKALETFIE